MTTLNAMIQAIRGTQGGVEFLAGDVTDAAIQTAAQQWVDAGFAVADAATYWDAGCFDAARTKALRAAGLDAETVAAAHPQHDGSSWGYVVCNGDASVAAAVAALAD